MSDRAMTMVEWLDKRFYPTQADNWDDELFRECVLQYLTPQARLLDIGAGAGILWQTNFRGLAREVVGIDLDPRVLQNPHLDRAVVANCEVLPFDDESFDVVVADNVLEHLLEPKTVFKEVWRVLRPGGVFVAKTPNRSHYMTFIARLTPLAFHKWYNSLRGRASEDTFPTQYRANSRRQLERIAEISGLELTESRLVEGRPEYLRMNVLTYLPGIIYERFVNAFPPLARFRIVLIVVLRKN